ncbi:MAG: hypothetical protein HZA53_01020 [Planctomycetes bacterium]|nr:hypothetical protein [Planctomycetota bacterium]
MCAFFSSAASPAVRSALHRAWIAIVLAVSVASCASYAERTSEAFGDFERGQFERSFDAYQKPKTTGSEFLAGAESGTVAMADGRWDDAVRSFERAMAVSKEADREALISAENLGDFLLSWTLSESAKRYLGEGYERVLLHSCDALARLARGDLDGARVEARRANQLLESEETLYEKEYKAGGLGHFISALVYELDGKPDEAFIDYRRMRAKGVGLALANHALVRLGRILGRGEDVEAIEKENGTTSLPPSDSAQIVVIAGVGIGPYKRENTLTIPTLDGILQWSVPSFERRPITVGDLELSVVGGDQPVRTVVIEDVSVVARENLEDRLLLLSTKSALRAVLKRELTQKLEKEVGILGRIAGDLFAIATERADLRSWTTLPDTWQAARVFVPAGAHALRLAARGGETQELGRFELAPGETMFVLARTIGTRLYARPVGGNRIQGSTPAPAATLEPATRSGS